MALPAGQITLTVEYAKDLKDKDFFGKQDPYAVVVVGSQRFRTKTHTDGGKNPVWNESFRFNVINENTATVEIYDEDTLSRDDLIGSCVVDLSKARMGGVDHVQAAVSTKKGKQHGFVSFRVAFERNGGQAGAGGQQQQQAGVYMQQPMQQPMPPAWAPYGAPMPYPGPPPAPVYGMPPPGAPYYPAVAPPPAPQFYAAPQPYPQTYPPPMRLY